jgi:hypothetical protein
LKLAYTFSFKVDQFFVQRVETAERAYDFPCDDRVQVAIAEGCKIREKGEEVAVRKVEEKIYSDDPKDEPPRFNGNSEEKHKVRFGEEKCPRDEENIDRSYRPSKWEGGSDCEEGKVCDESYKKSPSEIESYEMAYPFKLDDGRAYRPKEVEVEEEVKEKAERNSMRSQWLHKQKGEELPKKEFMDAPDRKAEETL